MQRLAWLPIAVLIAAACGGAAAPQAAPATAAASKCSGTAMEAKLTPLADSGLQGAAKICYEQKAVRVEMDLDRLAAGNAYTVWFIYVDRPTECKTKPCGGPDALGDNPLAAFGRMDGAVADPSGKLHLTGEIRDLRLSPGSLVWLQVFGHGQVSEADNRYRARQLLTPQAPALGAPGLGAAADGAKGSGVGRIDFNIP